jgi:S1-C subfamily serine protease
MRRLDIIALIAVVVVAVIGKMVGYGGDAQDEYQPRRPPPVYQTPPRDNRPQAPLPRRASSDGVFGVKVGPAGPSSGTAFSIAGDGRWLTARHVIAGCRQVVIRTARRKGVKVQRIVTHPNADVAVLWTSRGAPSLALSGAALKTGQSGFGIGFPGGNPGDVHGRILGRRVMRISGQYRTNEPVIAWSQLRRVPDNGPNLAGMSGGPMLDRAGRVIGIVVAGAPRRGRTYTAAPISLDDAVRRAKLQINRISGDRQPLSQLNDRDFPAFGRNLRSSLTVAKVFCMVGQRRARRPRI